MTNESLCNYAKSQGHEIQFLNLTENKAVTIEADRFYITLAKNISRIEEKELIAHELGHCEYGGTYCRHSKHSLKARAEYRASKWTYYQLVPPSQILACVRRGLVTPWELADHFDVSDEFMYKVVGYYQMVGVI